MRVETLFGGRGGQGILLMGRIYGLALSRYMNLHAVQAEVYGAATRGGVTRSDVIVSDVPEELDYPYVIKADIAVFLAQKAYNALKDLVGEDALIVVDSELCPEVRGKRVYRIPATRIAVEVGNPRAANMVMLGALSELLDFLNTEAVERSIHKLSPPKWLASNILAMKKGAEWIRKNINI